MMETIDSQTEKWNTYTEGIDVAEIEKVILAFDPLSKDKGYLHRIKETIDEYFDEGKKIIEIGGQFGVNLLIQDQGFQKTLLDIDKAGKIFSKFGQKAEFITGDMFDMPVKDETYDIAFNSGVLEHFTLQERTLAIKEYTRILKKGGIMILAVPNHNSLPYRFYYLFLKAIGFWKIPKEYKIKDFNEEIIQNNLRLIEKRVSCPEVIFENYNNLFGLGTALSALAKLGRKQVNPERIGKLNRKYGLGNIMKLVSQLWKVEGYLLTFIIQKP